VACPALPYSSTLSHNRHGFRKDVFEHKICILISFELLPERCFILKKNSTRYHHKCT